jgi:hypothetical protein
LSRAVKVAVLVAPSCIMSNPNCTPCRGSSTWTTAGMPSNMQNNTAGARRSRRSSRIRRGSSSEKKAVSASAGSTVKARTCRPGHPDTALDRRMKPLTACTAPP